MNDNLEKCEFRNYRGFRTNLEVHDLNSIVPTEVYESSESTTERTVKTRSDKVVVRIQEPIPQCDPYDIAARDELPSLVTRLSQ